MTDGFSLPGPEPAAAARRLETYLHEAIPLVTHMQVRVARFDAAGLLLAAPLEPNRNHIGTGFGGSLQGLATLACWGMLWLMFEDRPTHIVVQECQMRFLKPARQDFTALCPLPEAGVVAQCRRAMQSRGRARLELAAEVTSGTERAGHYQGRFVALRAEGGSA